MAENLKPVENAGIHETAGDVIESLNRNESVSPAAHTGPSVGTVPGESGSSGGSGSSVASEDAWKTEPKRYFETNPDGSIRFRDDGSPIRRRGPKTPPEDGDALAGGGTFRSSGESARTNSPGSGPGSGGASTSRIDTGQAEQVKVERTPKLLPLGPKAAKLITSAARDAGKHIAGPDSQPSMEEADIIETATTGLVEDRQVRPVTLLLLGIGAYLLRMIIVRRYRAYAAQPPKPVASSSPGPRPGPEMTNPDPVVAAYERSILGS